VNCVVKLSHTFYIEASYQKVDANLALVFVSEWMLTSALEGLLKEFSKSKILTITNLKVSVDSICWGIGELNIFNILSVSSQKTLKL